MGARTPPPQSSNAALAPGTSAGASEPSQVLRGPGGAPSGLMHPSLSTSSRLTKQRAFPELLSHRRLPRPQGWPVVSATGGRGTEPGWGREVRLCRGFGGPQGNPEWSLPLGAWHQKGDGPERPKAIRGPGDSSCLGSCKAIGSGMWSGDQSHQHPLRTCQKCKPQTYETQTCSPETLVWGPASCVLTIPPGGSDAHSNVRATVLEKGHQNRLGDLK